jgi:uncharacterized protein
MEPIYIPHIARAPEQTYKIPVEEPKLLDLETLTPVQGTIEVRHGGTFLEVKARAEGIMTLTCDRCLQQYNHRLGINASELIWLQEVAEEEDEPMVEREVALDDLVESLSPQGHFRPDEWLYEQFCLGIPQRQLCDRKCPGIPVDQPVEPEKAVDRRWASLESFKDQLG